MDYDFPGLSDMACNCYLKVCQSCKDQLTKNHSKKDTEKDPIKKALDPVVWDIFKNIGNKIQKLSVQNKLIYYEAIGVILSAIKDDNVLIEAIRIALSQLITSWKSFISSIESNQDKLRQDETLLNISFFINVNEKLNSCIKDRYGVVFEVIFNEMTAIYNFYSNTCKQEFITNKVCLTFYNFKKMRAVKRDVLRMFTIFIEHTTDKQGVATKYLPSLFDILKAYGQEPEQLREPETLLLFSKVIEVFGPLIAEYIPNILECIFGSTLSLISNDFSSYPDHRVNFFIFLKSVVETCFMALLSVPKEQLETVINCMIWSIKHELSSIYEVGLESLLALISVGRSDSESEHEHRAGELVLQGVLHADVHGRAERADRQAARERLRPADADPAHAHRRARPRRPVSLVTSQALGHRKRQQALRHAHALQPNARRFLEPLERRPPAKPAAPLHFI